MPGIGEGARSSGLAPSLTYVAPTTLTVLGTFGAGATFSESRDHTFNENIQISTRKIFLDWKADHTDHSCPNADTNLAGTLGLKDLVALAGSTPDLNDTLNFANKGVFGGSVQFVVTKNLTATGPSWALVRFKSLGAIVVNIEVEMTDRLDILLSPALRVAL